MARNTGVIDRVVALGVCQWIRPDNAPNRPGEPCGQVHTKCAGHKKASNPERAPQRGDPCGIAAAPGQTVCRFHGGASGQAKAAAQQRLEREAAEAAAVTFGLPVEVDPHEALFEELCRTNGHVHWLLGRIREIAPESITWGKVGHQTGVNSQGLVDVTTYRAASPVLFDLYERERKHLVAVAGECVKAGIEERRIRLAEEAGEREARLIEAFAAELGLDLQAPETRRAVERTFTLLDGGRAA